MAAPLVAALVRVVGSQTAKQAAKQAAKKAIKNKIKNVAKDQVKKKLRKDDIEREEDKQKKRKKKKLSKKSKIDSFNKNDEFKNESEVGGEEKPTIITSKKSKPVVADIKSADTRLSPTDQLRINVTNIHSFLVSQNKSNEIIKRENQRNLRKQQSLDNFHSKGKKLRFSPFGNALNNIKDSVPKPEGGNIFEKLFEFIGLVVLGIFINALPTIIETVKGIIDSVVNFLTPIQSGFNLVLAFFTGDLDNKELDADKKRVNDGLAEFDKDGGIIDQMAEKLGPLGGLVKMLKPLVGKLRTSIKGENTVLSKKGGKEGFLNKKTGEFTEKEWTSAERASYSGTGSGGSGGPEGETDEYTGEVKPGHYYFPLPKGMFAGAAGQWFGAYRDYGGHAGIDLVEKPPWGSNPRISVVALAGGKVIKDKYVPGREYMSGMMIQGEDGHDQRYLHMTPMKSPGDEVKAGEKIGELVDLKNSTHLHFEVYRRGQGGYLSPHKVYPKFFGTPNSAPRDFDSRTSASGGNKLINKSLNDRPSLNVEDPSIGKTEYYFIQPYDTVQTKNITYPVPMAKGSNNIQEVRLNALWSQ